MSGSSSKQIDRVPAAAGWRGRLPELALVVMTMVWGGTFLVTRLALREIGPFSFLSIRFAVGAAAIFLLFAPRMRGLTRAEVRAGLIISVAAFGTYALQTMGLQHIASSKSAFITAMYVPVVPVLQLLIYRKSPRAAAWLGIAMAFTGLLLLSAGEGLSPSFGVGEWLTLGGALAAAMQIVLIGRFARSGDPMRLAFVQLAALTAFSVAGMALAGERMPAMTPGLLAAGVGMGLFGTAFALAAMNWAQRTVSPTRATVIYAMEPVWGGLVGALAGEVLTAGMVGGSALIVTGVLVSELPFVDRLLTRPPRRPRMEEDAAEPLAA
jgi:drug/metabolite transporter (DMT)-like permease